MSSYKVRQSDLDILLAKYPSPEFAVEDYAGEQYFCVLDREEMSEEDPLPLGFGWTLLDAVAVAALRIREGLDETYRQGR